MRSFDLFFDESGNFEESPIVAAASIERPEKPQFSSQLVGLLAPAGELTRESAGLVLKRIHDGLGRELPEQLHAVETRDSDYYLPLVQGTLRAIKAQRWQPVRLLNKEQLGYGDKSATYTNLVAELVIRILTTLSARHHELIKLNITGATVMLKQCGVDELTKLELKEYLARINQYVSMMAVRLGVAHLHQRWEVGQVALGSGRFHRALQLCDILSNASFKNFRRCDPDTRQLALGAFAPFDYTLTSSDLLEHIDQHRDSLSPALALQAIAENWDRCDLHPELRQALVLRLDAIVTQLAGQSAAIRNTQLRQLVGWGAQYLELRTLQLADHALGFLELRVALPLRGLLSDASRGETDWFLAQLLVYQLVNRNHRGELAAARTLCERLDRLIPSLASDWEQAPLLTEALTCKAVHLNDCREYQQASGIMGAVDGYYSGLAALMSDALPGVFPARVRARHRGIALGTQLQSEMFSGLSDPARLEKARRLSDEALDEFSAGDDRARQFQYRCQLETYAGNFPQARQWLAQSLCCGDAHEDLSVQIRLLHGPQQGFALLHWSRIAMEAGRNRNSVELQRFLDAFLQGKFEASPWLVGQGQEYPAHGIRRHLAVCSAYLQWNKQSSVALKNLSALESDGKAPLALLKLAGIAEVAAIRGPEDPDEARRMITGVRAKEKPFTALLSEFAAQVAPFAGLKDVSDRLARACQDFEASNWKESGAVRGISRLIA